MPRWPLAILFQHTQFRRVRVEPAALLAGIRTGAGDATSGYDYEGEGTLVAGDLQLFGSVAPVPGAYSARSSLRRRCPLFDLVAEVVRIDVGAKARDLAVGHLQDAHALVRLGAPAGLVPVVHSRAARPSRTMTLRKDEATSPKLFR